MKVLVLGGCGAQGRTALIDLSQDPDISTIICADSQFEKLAEIENAVNMKKIVPVRLNAQNESGLLEQCRKADIIIDLLPNDFTNQVYEVALKSRVSLVNTNYIHDPQFLNQKAASAGIAIMPECGLDPGIDLVIYKDARAKFDSLTTIYSYCGGFPEKKACTNPLNYKVSWIWRGVLSSTKRDGRIIKDGRIVEVPGSRQHDEAYVHEIEFPGLGTLEAFPNGDAVAFTDKLGITKGIINTGRYSLRWPGWSSFWRPLKELGFLDEKPIEGLDISPMDFMDRYLAPLLTYGKDEKDLVVMFNLFEGRKAGKKMRYSSSMFIERDLETGIMAMSKGVAYTACIVAKMILQNEIEEKGVLSPMLHIPVDLFMDRLRSKGISLESKIELI